MSYIFMKGEKFVAMDASSGGYPYITDRPLDANHWSSVKEALEYKNHFPDEDWEIYRFGGLKLTKGCAEKALSIPVETTTYTFSVENKK